MDRSWISKPKTTLEYKVGVEQFLLFAFRDVPYGGKVLCPCVKCANCIMKTRNEIREDLKCDEFLRGYTRWNKHGEDLPAEELSDPSARTCLSNANHDIDTNSLEFDNMHGLLHAAFGVPEESSPCDAEVNPTVPESSPMAEQVENPTFANLSKDANIELYPGCKSFSKLSFIVRLYQNKCLYGWSKESVTAQLKMWADALPAGSHVPTNYYQAKKVINSLGLDYQKIHACPNDCMLFRGERENQDSCHVCGSSRWVASKKKGALGSNCNENKKKAAKILRYFPLIPRLQRIFAMEKTSKNMRWHAEERTKDGKLRHPADGQAWKELDKLFPSFGADPRNIRLGLATDGFNPFRTVSSTHSTWPVILVPYNAPPWLCMKQSNFILSMVIPGPKGPGYDIDVYLEPLIDEMMQLWSGVETYDASTKQMFNLHAALLWTIHDLPELSATNKENAKKIKYPHTLGRKSFARKRKELEDSRGQHVNRAVFFDECHKNKEGAYTNARTEEKMNEVYMKLAERMVDRALTEADYEEVMLEVFGKVHSGRVRGMGPTITPTNYYGARFWNLSNTNGAPCGSSSSCGSNWNDAKQFMQFVASFMAEKYPEVDWLSHLPESLRRRTEDVEIEESELPSDNSHSTPRET
ncbi:hypothetical protein ACP70R_004524 [Stipagrostis hirtigluma subsp. patula]